MRLCPFDILLCPFHSRGSFAVTIAIKHSPRHMSLNTLRSVRHIALFINISIMRTTATAIASPIVTCRAQLSAYSASLLWYVYDIAHGSSAAGGRIHKRAAAVPRHHGRAASVQIVCRRAAQLLKQGGELRHGVPAGAFRAAAVDNHDAVVPRLVIADGCSRVLLGDGRVKRRLSPAVRIKQRGAE